MTTETQASYELSSAEFQAILYLVARDLDALLPEADTLAGPEFIELFVAATRKLLEQQMALPPPELALSEAQMTVLATIVAELTEGDLLLSESVWRDYIYPVLKNGRNFIIETHPELAAEEQPWFWPSFEAFISEVQD